MHSRQDNTQRLLAAALSSDFGYQRLGYLCDRIGNRLSGSKGLERAVSWAESELRRDGLEGVRAEPVLVPKWVRDKESAVLVSPEKRPLVMLGLGGSVGGRVKAPVLVVESFDGLMARAGEVRGKIVCFNVPFTSYGATVRYRTSGASEAAKLGAVGVLVRSVGPTSLRTPHTGVMSYTDGIAKIPAAAITIEDATQLARMQARGEKPVVELSMQAHFEKDARSANVLGEWRGRERPEEIVLVGGHLDSWDVGQGAHDDGGGCIVSWEAVRLLKALNIRPRRTVRVCLFTNEENGSQGGKAYAEAHKSERHVLAIETDGGVDTPTGFGLTTKTPGGLERAREVTKLLGLELKEGGGGADIGPIGTATGCPTMGLLNDMSVYWNIHHTPADTFDKINPKALQKCIAAVAVMAYSAAELDGTL
ncbi:M20/M25/M40 family metallo-hydrolase [Armatimonas rosea]|uniref:Carboxypeptidase Q n=1 Tax=Armatimonas rosea TaxID=685828 RepID=A0A7W9SLR0_ARMRO|nr:M20/M25/M40 family metallo-hydrolase [Armatimonas rosea]MBB6048489.1 carboxypeptidase Q [Armatimonas rosea]